MSEQPYKYLNYSVLESALKARFGKITGYFEHINRYAAWWYKAKTNGTLKVKDLEEACDAAGIPVSAVFGTDLNAEKSSLEDIATAQRVSELIKATTGSTLDFALKTGINHQELNQYLDNAQELSMANLKRILVNFPNVNTIWLVFGTGDMFSDTETKENLRQIIADKVRIIELLETEQGKKQKK